MTLKMDALDDTRRSIQLDRDSNRAVAEALHDPTPSPRSSNLDQPSSPRSSLDSKEFSMVRGHRHDALPPAVRTLLYQAPEGYEEQNHLCRLYIPALNDYGMPNRKSGLVPLKYPPWEQSVYKTPAPAKRVAQSPEWHEMRALTAKGKI